jgi:acetyl-CoA acetyltransferase
VTRDFSGTTAIAGAANTAFSFTSERSHLDLALEAITLALEDAGLTTLDVDGITGYSFDRVREYELVSNLGLRDLAFFAESPYGNGCGAVALAALAVASGRADTVVAFRSVKAPLGDTLHFEQDMESISPALAGSRVHHAPFGLLTVIQWAALVAQRYVYRYKSDPDGFGWVTVVEREYAATNPAALHFGHPLSWADYLASPIAASPLRLPDGNVGNDGASAVVITTAERAADLRQTVIPILAAGWATGPELEVVTSYQRADIEWPEETALVARRLYAEAGIGPADVDFLEVYDHISALAVLSLEGLGFCGPGEAVDFVRGGANIRADGRLPLNTHGGHLGEAYVQTMNHVVEAVRQLRGEAANQVANATVGLVVGGSLAPVTGLVLGRA